MCIVATQILQGRWCDGRVGRRGDARRVVALDNYLPELAYDLARIDRERDRHEVAAFERTLAALRERLHNELAQRPMPAA